VESANQKTRKIRLKRRNTFFFISLEINQEEMPFEREKREMKRTKKSFKE
jgi:hypothetical protein